MLSIVVLLGAACAQGSKAGAGADANQGAPDGMVASTDAGPRTDAAPQAVQMFVHTRDTLYSMDDQQFNLTLIGLFNNGDVDITDLAVTAEGKLFGISRNDLWSIDRATGQATQVRTVPGVVNVGLTFLKNGTLLATDKAGGVRSIDPMSGAIVEVGSFGGGFATAGDLVAVSDGTMYAISDEGPTGDEFENNWLLTVNTTTGAATGVGQIGFGGVFGVAFANGKVIAFTRTGEVIEIDVGTGAGSMVKTYPVEFWGAGVSPLVVVD